MHLNPSALTPDSRPLTPSSDWPGWSIYLGVSWTWCIGMFLPVLLIRDYGLWGFAAFAVPNVVGAAAMGWMMRSAGQSERFVADHVVACGAFSFVTICFHAFFLGWISTRLFGRPDLVAVAFGGLALVMFLLMRIGDGLERWIAVAAALVSWFLFVLVLRYRMNLGIVLPDSRPAAAVDLASLAAVCVLGFALCPYLDRTFHLVRQRLSVQGSKWAFGMGFGVVFLSMILFTLIYSDLIFAPRINETILLLILVHLIVQSAFTVAAHGATTERWSRALVMYAAAVIVFVGGMLADRIMYDQTSGGELGYRLFMGFYGLIAPAYVCICATTGSRPARAYWIVFLAALAAATPMFWLAFIERRMAWAGGGVALILAARWLIGSRPTMSSATA